PGEEEERITLPCTVNGQMASGEVNRYRFEARRGQRLVITTLGRQLVPFIADAVPGWFQPVLALYDPGGKEVAYGDDYRFKPDPTIFYEVARDGDYVCTIRDSLYRGREDFVYRITIGEVPFITSIFPLGGPAETPARPAIRGWNLGETGPAAAAGGSQPDICSLYVTNKGLISNRVPFGLGKLPETLEREPNGDLATAQKVMLPTIINGRIDKPGDRDVFQFTGKANDVVVAEVQARRLDSPLDSVITLDDAAGRLLALNDDHEDLASGLNTHQADSYLMAKLPADGRYFVQISDAARQGGEEYGYRLRLSAPQPDFDLRVVPSSVSLPARSNADLTMYVQRRDGFAEPVTVFLKDAVPGFSASPVTMVGTQTVARLTINTDLTTTKGSVALSVLGRATVAGQEIVHAAVPAEDRMQAFLWRHLVPARELRALVFEPSYEPPPKRLPPPRPPPVAATNAPSSTNVAAATAAPPADKPTFTKEQAAARLKLLKRLFEEGMFTDEFYLEKVAECEATE
ncbi:MAG TPA: peptidase, partial [Anaerolineae bacterium]